MGQPKKILKDKEIKAGKEIFNIQCSSCHSKNGPNNDILPLTKKFTLYGLDSQLNGQGKLRTYMPEFFGLPQERKALAKYIVRDLHSKPAPEEKAFLKKKFPYSIPDFEPNKDMYLLLAWNDLGMHCFSDGDPFLLILPPGNNLHAQLIQRGPRPKVIQKGVTLEYRVEEGFGNPAGQSNFWSYAKDYFGKDLKPNMGLKGFGINGKMRFNKEKNQFEALMVPVVAYSDQGEFNPYPLFQITARDNESGQILAKTKVVAPSSSEMNCKRCHGGDWRVNGKTGISKETALDILKVHDKNSRTSLLEQFKSGTPILCQRCHADPALGKETSPVYPWLPNLSAAIHGWHANYLTNRDSSACTNCHPADPKGATRCLRGTHAKNFNCIHCHGTLEDHALSLLKAEQNAGKKTAHLMKHLEPRSVKDQKKIQPRRPWLQEPDCLTCHKDFKRPGKEARAHNVWTKNAKGLYRSRHENTGQLGCPACHSSPHAIYPAKNMYKKDRDNIQPLQYQKMAASIGSKKNCAVCHTMNMPFSIHHPNMIKQ